MEVQWWRNRLGPFYSNSKLFSRCLRKRFLIVWSIERTPTTAPILPGWKDAQGNYVSCPAFHEKCEHLVEVRHLDIKKIITLMFIIPIYFNINKILKFKYKFLFHISFHVQKMNSVYQLWGYQLTDPRKGR